MTTEWPPPPPQLFRITVERYHRMIEAGVLDEDDNVELLEGWLVAKLRDSPAHAAMISVILNDVFASRLPPDWHCRGRSGFTTTDSEPEPDITVIRGDPLDYMVRHPGPADAALVVEVAERPLELDQRDKARIYARAGVPVYWIINLVAHQVEVYCDPTGPDAAPAYRARHDYQAGDSVPLVVDGRDLGPIPAQELLP